MMNIFKKKQHLQMKRLCTQTMMSVLFSLGVVEKKIELGSRYHSCAWLDGSYVTNIHALKRSVVF
jgi:hypothetical protein